MGKIVVRYSAWLINHADIVAGITVPVLIFGIIGMWAVVRFHLFDPNVHPFTFSSIALIFALVAPIACSAYVIAYMRLNGARERSIKITAMVVFFGLLMSFVYYAWNLRALGS
jgi:hypothetical protein